MDVGSQKKQLQDELAMLRDQILALGVSEIQPERVADILASLDSLDVRLTHDTAEAGQLRKAGDELEARVRERTAELRELNERLIDEVKERRAAEEALQKSEARFRAFFEKNLAVKLLIDPVSGAVVDANLAACSFYGYPLEDLKKRTIFDINTLPRQRVVEELQRAAAEKRNHFFFKHRLAAGEIRDVEVHSSPIESDGKRLLYSIIHDVTDRKRTEAELEFERHKFMSIANTTENLVYIINAQQEIEYLNPAAERELGPVEGLKCYEYFHEKKRPATRRRKHTTPGGAGRRLVWTSPRNHKTYDVFDAALKSADGTVSSLRILHDITEHKRIEEALRLDEARLEALLQLSQMSEATVQEITDFALGQAVTLTKSKIGFIGSVNEDGTIFTNHAWSSRVMAECKMQEKPIHYPLETAGIWSEAVRQRGTVIINDYSATIPHKRGYPGGHVRLSRLMSVPLMEGDRVVLIAVVANKKDGYEPSDVRQLTLLMDGIWKILRRKEIQDALKESEKQLRALSSKLLKVQEEERARLSQELHDGPGQTLAAIKYGVENALAARGRSRARAMSQCLEPLVPVIQKALDGIRSTYMNLRPTILDDFGIIAASEWLCRQFEEHHPNINIIRDIRLQETEVPDSLKISVFRIIQEGLKNVVRHSMANTVHLSLCSKGETIELAIRDNGAGFDTGKILSFAGSSMGVGLASMRELTEHSGGSFSVDSTVGKGTTVRAAWTRKD